MSELGELQRRFPLMLAQLFIYAYLNLGIELTLGEGYDDDGVGHMKGSTHYDKIGHDLNIFKNDVWLKDGIFESVNYFKLMHDFWELIGGAKRIETDLNHFSLLYQGKR